MNRYEQRVSSVAATCRRVLFSLKRGQVAPAVIFATALFAPIVSTAQQNPANAYHVTILEAPEGVKELTVNGIGSGQAVGYASSVGPLHAIMWSAGAHRPIDMHIPGCSETRLNGASGKTQVGQALGPATNSDMHAVLWRGAPQSAVDLNPMGVSFSVALGCGGNQQAGVAHSGDPLEIAIFWKGTAESAVNLHPNGFLASRAVATDGRRQVGTGLAAVRVTHALLWSGSAQSVTDLHPVGWGNSYATSIDGKTQAGYADSDGKASHAMLWSSVARSAVDLHTANFESSQVNGIHANVQVGFGGRNGHNHALLWQGSAQSAFDLESLLPGYENSEAIAIDELGNITGKAYNKTTHRWDIILWQHLGSVPRQS